MTIRFPEEDPAEDGHPCEAALEFRRATLISGIANEVPADALDLAISIAWLGKAASRTEASLVWLESKIDVNTWQVVAVAAQDTSSLQALRHAAVESPAIPCFAEALERVRRTKAFANACAQVDRAMNWSAFPEDAARLSILRKIAIRMPPMELKERPAGGGKLLIVDFAKKARAE